MIGFGSYLRGFFKSHKNIYNTKLYPFSNLCTGVHKDIFCESDNIVQ